MLEAKSSMIWFTFLKYHFYVGYELESGVVGIILEIV